ncbi:MAG: hypothetical protein M3Y59_09195 [Myxococcota bacterium]|nr:hypothetical protein [Myxococcota bacterium]
MSGTLRLLESTREVRMLGKPKKPPRKSPKPPKKEGRLTIQPVGKPWAPKKKPRK